MTYYPDIAQTSLDVPLKIKSNMLASHVSIEIFSQIMSPSSRRGIQLYCDFRYPETFTYSRLNSVGTSNYFHPQTLNGRLHCFPKGVLFGAVYSPFPRIIWSVLFWRKLISWYFLIGGFSNGKQAICMNFEDSKWMSQEGVITQIWIKTSL